MPVYNGVDFVQEAIDSILSQDYADFEFIIIDDCSTDNTWNLLTQNARQDNRIKLLRNSKNLGLIKTLNRGIKTAKGDYIARQDADDISLPKRFQCQVQILEENSDCALVSSNIQVVSGAKKTPIELLKRSCKPALATWFLLFYNRISGHSQVMYRREVVLSLGSYSETYSHIEDYELWCRISRTGQKIVILPQTFLIYRRHEKSISAQQQLGQKIRRCKIVKDNLKNLIGQELSLEEAEYLMGFWQGSYQLLGPSLHHRFPPSNKAELIKNRLMEIKKGFIKKYQKNFSDMNMEKELENLIAQQFLLWIQSPLTSQHSISSKLQISRQVFPLCGFKVLISWLIWILRCPLDTGISIFYKTLKPIN